MIRFSSLICAAVSMFIGSAIAATDAKPTTSLIDVSGVASHLESVQTLAIKEGTDMYAGCESVDSRVDRSSAQQEVLRPATLKKIAEQYLFEHIDEYEKHALSAWYASPLGQKIQSVEKRFEALSAAEYDQQFSQFLESGQLTQARFDQVSLLNRHLLVTEFITVMNVEISVAATLIGECSEGIVGLKRVDNAVSEARADREFVTHLMRSSINYDSAFIYAPLSNVELGVYIDFAKSPLGQRYHQALVSATEKTLRFQNDKLSSRLFAEAD